MLSEHISGESCCAAEMRCSTVMVTAPPVVMLTTASQPCLMRGRNCMNTLASGDGRPSFGSRACKCNIAAPALAASTAWVAIWSGVIGSASDIVGVWIEPVIAQLITTLLASWGMDAHSFRSKLPVARRAVARLTIINHDAPFKGEDLEAEALHDQSPDS